MESQNLDRIFAKWKLEVTWQRNPFIYAGFHKRFSLESLKEVRNEIYSMFSCKIVNRLPLLPVQILFSKVGSPLVVLWVPEGSHRGLKSNSWVPSFFYKIGYELQAVPLGRTKILGGSQDLLESGTKKYLKSRNFLKNVNI